MGCDSSKPAEEKKADNTYIFVDLQAKASDKSEKVDGKWVVTRKGDVPIANGSDAEQYWAKQTAGRTQSSTPTLVIPYGPPGCGKSSRVLPGFLRESLGWGPLDYVQLDPDVLREYIKEFRLSLSGAHTMQIPEVKAELVAKYGEPVPTKWLSPEGFEEDGFTVDGSFPALASATVRSNRGVRSSMLWGAPQPGGETPMTDCFVDRALQAGYNIVYDTAGNEATPFSEELIRRARSQHAYRIVVVGCFVPRVVAWERCEKRAVVEGRQMDRTFFDNMYGWIFPDDVSNPKWTTYSGGTPNQAWLYGKYRALLRPGDLITLIDNGGEKPITLMSDEVELQRI